MWGILHIIMSVPHNIVMNLHNVIYLDLGFRVSTRSSQHPCWVLLREKERERGSIHGLSELFSFYFSFFLKKDFPRESFVVQVVKY